MDDIAAHAAAIVDRIIEQNRRQNLAGPRYRSKLSAHLNRTGRMDKWFIDQMGCSQALFYAIERGDRFPTKMYRRLAAQVLGVDMTELFEELPPEVGDEDQTEGERVRALLAR